MDKPTEVAQRIENALAAAHVQTEGKLPLEQAVVDLLEVYAETIIELAKEIEHLKQS
jgi:hypothetical protein